MIRNNFFIIFSFRFAGVFGLNQIYKKRRSIKNLFFTDCKLVLEGHFNELFTRLGLEASLILLQ